MTDKLPVLKRYKIHARVLCEQFLSGFLKCFPVVTTASEEYKRGYADAVDNIKEMSEAFKRGVTNEPEYNAKVVIQANTYRVMRVASGTTVAGMTDIFPNCYAVPVNDDLMSDTTDLIMLKDRGRDYFLKNGNSVFLLLDYQNINSYTVVL